MKKGQMKIVGVLKSKKHFNKRYRQYLFGKISNR